MSHGVQHVKNATGNSNEYNTSKKLSVNLLWKLFPPLQYPSQRWFQVDLQSQPAGSQTVESQIGHTRCRKPCHQQCLGPSSHTLRRKAIVRLSGLIHSFLENKLIGFLKLLFLQARLGSTIIPIYRLSMTWCHFLGKPPPVILIFLKHQLPIFSVDSVYLKLLFA